MMTEIPSAANGDILIIDDNVSNLKTLDQLLRDAGHQVRCAANSRTALMLVAARVPEILLLDVRMPGMDGFELCATFKANPAMSLVPVIFLSAAGELRDKLAGFAAGAVDYILKPFDVDDVLIRIQTHLKLHRFQLALAGANERVGLEVQERTQELRSALAALQQSEQNYREIFNATSDALIIHDADGRIVDVNEPMCAMFGCDRAQALTWSLKDICLGAPPFYLAEAEKNFRKALEQGPHVVEWRSKRGNGQAFWTEVALKACEIAGKKRVIASIRDISARKVAETALAQSVERHLAILRTAMDGYCLMDRNGHILEVNETYCRISGYSEREILSLSIADLEASETPEMMGQHMRLIMERGEDRFETVHRRKDGTLYQAEITTQYQPDDGGRFVAFVRDITERKRIELQLREVQKMESIGHLAGGVAHDFNNILAATMMQLDLLQHNHLLSRESQEILNDLVANTKRAASLTRQLLIFSRRSVMEIKALDLNDVVENLLKMLGRLIGENIDLIFSPGATLPAIEADAGMLEQVIMNLAVNARDAMPKGGQLRIETSSVAIDEAITRAHPGTRPGNFVKLVITDTGCGMDEGTLKRIFEPFFTTKEVGKGTGLGLATVYGILAQHKGWIEVESHLGQGSSFHFFLPATHKQRELLLQPAEEFSFEGNETILVVEDDYLVRRALGLCLRGLGYQVLEAANAREGLAHWQTHSRAVDLLLSDMVLPEGLTGMELAEKLMSDKPELKVIISSGYSGEIHREAKNAHESFVFLSKPYELPVLGQKIRECLASKAH